MPPTITVDFAGAEFPPIPLLAQDLQIEYDDDTGRSVGPDGEDFTMDCYSKAGFVRFDSPGELPDVVFQVILNFPPSKANVLIQEDENDEGISIRLNDFQTMLMEDE